MLFGQRRTDCAEEFQISADLPALFFVHGTLWVFYAMWIEQAEVAPSLRRIDQDNVFVANRIDHFTIGLGSFEGDLGEGQKLRS